MNAGKIDASAADHQDSQEQHWHSKELVDGTLTNTLEESVRDERVAGVVVYATEDHREGVEAFREGRKPGFEGS